MQKSTITEFNWYEESNPNVIINAETEEKLIDFAETTISTAVSDGFTSGFFNTDSIEDGKNFRCSWEIVDVSRPLDLYNHLVKQMKKDIRRLISFTGVESKYIQGLKVLDISGYELEIGGQHILEVGDVKMYNDDGNEFNLCLLERELEAVLDLIDDIKATS